MIRKTIVFTSILMMCIGHLYFNHYSKNNCYDSIIEKMSKPQYWNETQAVRYSTAELAKEAKKSLIDATGWYLIEDEDVIFARGYQGQLRLNFSKYQAETRLKEEFISTKALTYYRYDFKQNNIDLIDLESNLIIKNFGHDFKNQDLSVDRFNVYDEIKSSIDDYIDHFDMIGCPLNGLSLNEFKQYKRRKIDARMIEETNDTSVWENIHQVYYNSKQYPQINNFDELNDFSIDNYSEEYLLYENSKVYYYNPIFVLFKEEENNDQRYYEQLMVYPNQVVNFFQYYVDDLCIKMFTGQNCIFQIKKEENGQTEKIITFNDNLKHMTSNDFDINTALLLYYYPNDIKVANMIINDLNNDMIYNLHNYLNEILLYYGHDANHDLTNINYFLLYHNLYWQRLLGLR